MIDRQSLAWQVGIRLAIIMLALTAIGLGWLVWHTSVIEAAHGPSNLVHAVIQEFFLDLAWGVPVFIALIILIGAWALRRALLPLRQASAAALEIGPDALHQRIPTARLPSEIRPLAEAANDAFDRVEKAYRTQQRFVANAAHELRTPIAVARAAVERLPKSAEQREVLADMVRLSHLASQLLELARLERPLPASARLDAVPYLQEIARELAASSLDARDVRVALEAPNSLFVRADSERLIAIIRNLIENAVHHEPRGGEILIRLTSDGQMTVDDRGPGIPAGDEKRIFERFERGSWTKTSGSGLGLAIVKEACAMIGATIRVENRASGGARFSVGFRLA